MATYIHERADWPNFTWDAAALAAPLAGLRYRQGLMIGRMDGLGLETRQEADLENIAATVVRSSAIEGDILDYAAVRSSVARNIGIDDGVHSPFDRHIDGTVQMTLDATKNYFAPLTRERLFGWHALLFPTGYSGMRKIPVGGWRNEESDPMQVISGGGARERVHFEAPSAARLPGEMTAFLEWLDSPHQDDPLLRAGVAHLYFVTLHPFADGNGRIARAIADMCLARAEDDPMRFYSVSSAVERNRPQYYDILESTQRGGMEITRWLSWFIGIVGDAIEGAEKTLNRAAEKRAIWRKADDFGMNQRQRVVLTRLLGDFKGNLTSGRYAKLAKCSTDTALRDIEELIRADILARNDAGGRSTSYRLNDANER